MSIYNQAPIPTEQDGVVYDSVLEARHAEYMRLHCMAARYHPGKVDFKNGLIYSPDFWIARSRMWGECKWNPTGADRERIETLCIITKSPCVLLLPDGLFEVCDETGSWHDGADCSLVYCKHCGHYYYTWRGTTTNCRCCGHDGGRLGRVVLYYGNYERGKVGEPARYFSRCAYASARERSYHRPLYIPGHPESIGGEAG